MVVYIKMSKEEKRLATDYAKRQGLKLKEAMKKTFFEMVEDEYDIACLESTLKDHEKNPKTYSHEEIKKELDL